MDLSREAIAHLIAVGQAQDVSVDTPDGGQLVLVPKDYTPHVVPPGERELRRIMARPTFYDLASWADYVNRFKSDATRVFALPGQMRSGGAAVVAMLDYHEPAKPQHLAHQATYVPRYSEEWSRWRAVKPMLQVEFAEFIEENRRDIRMPDAALLLDIVTKFKATKKTDYDSAVYQPDGSVLIAFSDKVQSAGPGVAVPSELELGIPVFFRGTIYKVPVFMRYKLSDGGRLTFTLKLDRSDYIEQAAFDEITAKVGELVGVPVYIGTV
jgi:uncharacterized protein YfdQ (DUF2303 family)